MHPVAHVRLRTNHLEGKAFEINLQSLVLILYPNWYIVASLIMRFPKLLYHLNIVLFE